MEETGAGKRKADGEFIVKKVFDGSEPEPKIARKEPPPPPVSSTDDDEAPAPAPPPKPASNVKLLDFKDLKPDHLAVANRQDITKKNGARFVKVELNDKSTVIRSPKLFFSGIWSNDSGYTLHGVMLGVPGNRQRGEPIPPDPKYPNAPAEELTEKEEAHDAALDLDEFFIKILVNNPQWYKRQPATDEASRAKLETFVRKWWRPIAQGRYDEDKEVYYSPQFTFTMSVAEDGKDLFVIRDDAGNPVDPKSLVLTQGGEKKPGMFCRVGFTVRRITFPNNAKNHKFALQLIVQSVRLLRGSGGSFKEEFREVSLE